jgi:hypothetical protein
MIFYIGIYNEITSKNEYIKILNNNKNKNLKDNVNEELTLRAFHDIINTCYKEIIDTILKFTSKYIVNKELSNFAESDNNEQLKNKILNILKQFNTIENKPNNSNSKKPKYYLDENYIDYTPIDVELFTCVKNNLELIKLIRKYKYIKTKEYQEILFRLGDQDILNYLNPLHNKSSDFDKIKPIDLTYYKQKHEKKFENNVKFLIDKFKQDLIKNELGMFKINDNILEIIKNDLPIPSVFNNTDIINDIANTRIVTTKYITDNIKNKLKIVFKDVIIPTLKDFFKLYVGSIMDDIIDYTKLEYIIEILINDIINKILQVDITQIDEDKISMNDVVTNLSNVFTNRLKNYSVNYKSKQFSDVYDEMFKQKLISFLDKITNYYNNLYQNHIKFIFNHTRYSKLTIT